VFSLKSVRGDALKVADMQRSSDFRARLSLAALPLRVVGVAVVAVAVVAVAQGAASSGGSRLYAPCVVCHQPNAGGSPDGNIPVLAGQQKRYLEEQMALFRSGARMDSAMQVVAAHRTFSDRDDITALASYLAGLSAPSRRVEGPGQQLDLGQQLFARFCAGCHGVDGRGDRDNRVPLLAGQHYPYLKRQIEAAANLHKDIAPPEMISALRAMRAVERQALADYLSRLGQPESSASSNRVGGAAP